MVIVRQDTRGTCHKIQLICRTVNNNYTSSVRDRDGATMVCGRWIQIDIDQGKEMSKYSSKQLKKWIIH